MAPFDRPYATYLLSFVVTDLAVHGHDARVIVPVIVLVLHQQMWTKRFVRVHEYCMGLTLHSTHTTLCSEKNTQSCFVA